MPDLQQVKKSFRAYLEAMLGNPYVWGGKGENLTNMSDPEKWIKQKEEKNGTTQVNRALAFFRKVVATLKKPIYAFDCSGLVTKFLVDNGLFKKHRNADTLFHSECKEIYLYDLQPFDLVFIGGKNGNRNSMKHVGIYIGEANADHPSGFTIEAYGRDRGVVKLPMSKGEWTHAGRLNVLMNDSTPIIQNDYPTLRKGDKGEHVVSLQKLLIAAGYILSEYGPDGSYGTETENQVKEFQRNNNIKVDGICGKDTWNLLIKKYPEEVEDSDGDILEFTEGEIFTGASAFGYINGGTVNIREGAGTQHDILAVGRKHDKLLILNDAAPEWFEITAVIDGEFVQGYISNKYVSAAN